MSLSKSKCWYSNNHLHFFKERCSISEASVSVPPGTPFVALVLECQIERLVEQLYEPLVEPLALID
jgi:hypothetical protein